MNEEAARNFSVTWHERGDEKSDTQKFWLTLLRKVFDVAEPEELIDFEKRVKIDDQTKFIDGYISRTKILIEQKSFGTDLNKIARQSDGEYLTPFEQAKRYAEALTYSERPRRIIICNFDEFRIYDLRQMDSLEFLSGEKIYSPTILKLENFRNDFAKLEFIVNPNAEINPEVKISTDAAKIVRKICAALDKDYSKRDEDYIDALSKLCARLVFCFYADDAGLFKDKFGDYLKNFSHKELGDALQKFFDALNTPQDKRADLKNFPYVDGGLFDEKIPIPPLNQNFKFALERAHILEVRFEEFIKFSWREIDATIFGAMFEALFNPDTRRSDGIHYTAIENIHKVIDPLFLDDLNEEFADIKRMQKKNRIAALKNFQDKLASLNFLDPACGSGNFLTETYLSLRRLENEIIRELKNLFAEIPKNPVKVSPRQFYGIEINDFAVAVAKDALWIAEIQMLRKTSWIIGETLKELPLRKNISIVKANALRVDWKKIAPEVDFVIGNPPFVGARMKNSEQTKDIQKIFDGWKNLGNLDYVACWYKKAADFMAEKKIRAALVSTNSVCQGDSVGTLWKNLFAQKIHIDFCHRTFKWHSELENPAHVHCVVVGFSSAPNDKPKIIFDGKKKIFAENINAYLVDGEDIFVESRPNHLQDFVPKMCFGSMPNDGGNLIIEVNELETFLKLEPAAQKYVFSYVGAEEFIHDKKRYCLWLEGVPMSEIEKMPLVLERVEKVREHRLASKSAGTRKLADKASLFYQNAQPKTNYILIPRVSSENRKYIPIGFLEPKIIASDATLTIPAAQIYHFGILTSSIHMAWMRTVCGRLESRYRYSATVVYNNFVWCEPTSRQRRRIEQTAQEILDVRADFPDWTFAKLYDEATMPKDLRDAHKENDLAVALAYGFENFLNDEPRLVAELMKLYKAIADR